MKKLFRVACAAALAACAVAAASAEGPADAVYAKYADSVGSSYDYLKAFASIRDDAEAAEKAVEALAVLEATDAMVAELTAAMPEGFGAYQGANPAAAEAGFAGKMSFLGNYADKARERISDLAASLLGSIKSNVAWLERGGSPMTASEKLARIDHYFSILDAIAKDDPAVAAAKADYLPRARAGYKASMAKLGEVRMPGAKYSGGDGAALVALFSSLYEKRVEAKPLRVVIVDPQWVERRELAVRDGVIYVETYLYLAAHVAIKADKEAMVYEVSFRKQKTAGGFGPAELYAFGLSYPILLANVKK